MCSPTFAQIEVSLSPARLQRYMGAANGDKHHALRLYIWNTRLGESFYLPSQICEITVRNAIHRAVRANFGEQWHQSPAFTRSLPDRLKNELTKVIQDETVAYGAAMTNDHLVSGLSFGFWVNLLTSRYDHTLWPRFFPRCFPNKPANIGRPDIQIEAEQFRMQRNRIAHHKPLFDRNPVSEYQRMLKIIGWVSPETFWFVQKISNVSQTINARPPY